MKRQSSQFFPAAVVILTCAMATFPRTAGAQTTLGDIPAVWKESPQVKSITRAIAPRIITADEPWAPGVTADQFLQTGDATRTITLAPISGNGGFAVGAKLSVRAIATAGHRILFRKADGELIAFWGAQEVPVTKRVSFEATENGWHTRVTEPGFFPPDNPAFHLSGANIATRGHVYAGANPENGAGAGYSISFETEAPVLYLASRGRDIRFRLVADELIVAHVAINRDDDGPAMIPIVFDEPAKRHIEILAEKLDFGGIETVGVRDQIREPKDAARVPRTLWICEPLADAGTRGFPWVAAHLLGYEVHARAWSQYAPRQLSPEKTRMPAEAIARDAAALNPDVIVFSADCFDETTDRRDYARFVGEWFDVLDKTFRSESLKIALPSWKGSGPIGRESARRAKIVAKEARRRSFLYIDWQGWIDGHPDDPTSGNAHLLVASDADILTEPGHRYIGHRFAQEVRRANVEKFVQAAVLKRRQKAETKNAMAVDGRR